jgi:hypothetical protein
VKRALARIAVIGAFAIAALGSCSIRHRSGDFTCDVNTDCEAGRICDNGYCIVPGTLDAPRLDAAKPGGDGGNCPAPCTSCNVQQKTCTVNCQQANCTNTVVCPAGYKCDIQCNVESSCRNGVNCQQSASCNVECSGRQSCQNVVCGPGPCDVGCSGVQSCRGVACSNSCACDVTCTGNQSCGDGIQCTSLACRSTTGPGCTSVPAFCHSCN